ncbi:hypothetical protein BaRGS_00001782 [Batillaria attramentaria]|uniref:PLAT domain-containing protein n=1 Tax=Batillaria attramentaria TaxID=370345 RepID=A0ABD0M676_9CAEN
MSVSEHSVWHKPPTAAMANGSYASRRERAVRYTWAGPFNTQLYDDQLRELSNTTRDNLNRLASNMRKTESCDQYGIRHWHPESRPVNGHSAPVQQERPQSRGSWSNMSVMFTSADALSSAPRSKSIPRPIKQRIDYIAPRPKQKKKVEERPLLMDALYKVTVWTGDVPGGSTDANVHITIVGEDDMLPKTRLWHRQGTSKFCFVRGSKEVFYLKSPKLGNLRMITIEHDGLEKRHSWYLDRLEIQCMDTKRVWIFTCKNWLSMHHGDFRIKRDLEPKEKEKVWREFEVTVETGQKRLAGTDANVYITVHGTEGSSTKIHLNAKNRKDCFQKGMVNKFRIRVHDIGEIRSLRVEHDASGLMSGWFLEKITLQDIHNPACMYHFLYHGWLAKDVGDGHLWRELRAKKHLPKEVTTGKPVQYKVIVKTGDIRYAGTDANVYVVFVGSAGKTTKLFMDDSRDNFERDMEETFEVKVRKYLSRQEIAEQITQQRKLWKTKKQRQRKRLADKLNRQDTGDSDVSDSGDESEKETSGKRERRVSKEERFAEMFDRDGKVVKVPVFEEYYFPCSKWFATDEADGLIERELDVGKQTLFFQERE